MENLHGLLRTYNRYIRTGIYAIADLKQVIKIMRARREQPIRMGGFSFILRPGIWDYACVWETLVEEAYTPFISNLPKRLDTVIDLGGYIGDFEPWVNNKFHPRRIIVVDADPENFRLLPINIKNNHLTNVLALNKAIFSTTGKKVSIKAPSKSIHAIKSISTQRTGNTIETISFPDLLRQNKVQTIDFLKVDIEGAEQYVFTKENFIIFRDRVRFVALEAHPSAQYDPHGYVSYLRNLGYTVKYKAYTRWKPGTAAEVTLEIQAINGRFSELK